MKHRTLTQAPSQALTLAEICEAIASGTIPATIENGYYTVSHRALKQLRSPAPSLVAMPRPQPQRQPAELAS